MNLYHRLEQQANAIPDTIAIQCDKTQRTLTYKEFATHCERYCQTLALKGITKNSRVLVLQGMSIELYVLLMSLFRLGAVAVFVDPSQSRKFIFQCVRQVAPDALFSSPLINSLSFFWATRWKIPTHLNTRTVISDTNIEHTKASEQSITPDQPALLTFTSGSTGQPKIIERSHAFLNSQLSALTPHLELESQQKDLCTLPIFLLANLASGVTSFIPAESVRHPGKIQGEPLVSQMNAHDIQRMSASPALLEKLIKSNNPPASLEQIFTGGAPVLPTLMDRLEDWAPRADITAVYGSSEAEPISRIKRRQISEADREKMKHGAGLLVGKPIEEIELKIIKNQPKKNLLYTAENQFENMQQATNRRGEIIVTGKHVLAGYLDGLGDEENKLSVAGKRWHRTGDSGYLDSEGKLWLTGRCNAIVEHKTKTIYPFSVEVAAAMLEPSIQISAVVLYSNRCYLLVVSDQTIDTNRLQQALAEQGVERVQQVNSLPVDKRHNAKINYHELNKLLPKVLVE